MNRTQQRRSVTPGHIPAVGDLLVGEIALNLADKDAFFSTGVEIVHLNAAANIKTDAAHRFISDAQLAILAAGYTLPVSSASVLGGVKIGANIDVDAEGVISLKTASASQAGLLSAADFAAFADKQDALGYVPVNKAGDVMGGALTLFGAPTADNHAATKKYVDDGLLTRLGLDGGTMSGLLVLSADPTQALGAATKQYVDAATSLVSGRLAAPVQSLAELEALAGSTDKEMILVEDNGSLYRFDQQSVLAADGSNVIEPSDGIGRWIKVSAAVQNHEMLSGLAGGASNDHLHLTTAEKNSYDAHLVDAVSHLSATQATFLGNLNASAAEINFLVGVTSSVQGQLDAKQASLGFTPVNKAGDTMLGALYLSQDPVAAMEAVTLQYLNNYVVDCGVY